ncbi:tripartite tricarboxylate transporter substrate-binding protein [Variovorax sp. SRS16]|uniref:tripartite tricarboxylate transporter substrate-binding protein n=1 Tax=Variovorax sp. SRS16 TaxID=282217 RepID=UPI0013A57DEA|nr:tripartite tricarboxylate transporter substrate-binding protein [Variovorax sp. SRS16]
MNRRSFALSSAAMTAALALPAAAQLQRTTRLIVGFPPGGAADVLARALLEPMKTSLGVPLIVENRPGAGGRIAVDVVGHAPADGSVLLVSPGSVLTLAPHLYKSVRYDLARDFMPIAPIARLDLGVYAGPGTPENLRTLPEVVKWLKSEPSKRSCGITGLGSTPHLAALLLGRASGAEWQTVPYQGDAPAFIALLGGEIPVCVASLAGGMEHVRAGKLRLLALTGNERSTFMPDVPTLTQIGYDVVVADRHSLFAPRQTSAAAVASIRAALEQALGSPGVGAVLERMSLQRASAVADFPAQLRTESESWEKAVKAFNITLEG